MGLAGFHADLKQKEQWPMDGAVNQTRFDAGWRLYSPKDPVVAPNGIATNDSKLFWKQYERWVRVPEPKDASWNDYGFLLADYSGVNEFAHVIPGDKSSALKFHLFNYDMIGMTTDEEF